MPTTINVPTADQLVTNRTKTYKVDDTLTAFEKLIDLHRKCLIEVTEIKLYDLCAILHNEIGGEYARDICLDDLANVYPLSRLPETSVPPDAIERKFNLIQMEDETILTKC
jgi:hypothetical protein